VCLAAEKIALPSLFFFRKSTLQAREVQQIGTTTSGVCELGGNTDQGMSTGWPESMVNLYNNPKNHG